MLIEERNCIYDTNAILFKIHFSFQMVLPVKWQDAHLKPVCIHLAGTGDHVSNFLQAFEYFVVYIYIIFCNFCIIFIPFLYFLYTLYHHETNLPFYGQ